MEGWLTSGTNGVPAIRGLCEVESQSLWRRSSPIGPVPSRRGPLLDRYGWQPPWASTEPPADEEQSTSELTKT